MSFNIVTFRPDASDARLAIKLQGAFALKGGLEANVNRAVCSYLEFAKLGGNPAQQGTIEFWQNSNPHEDGAEADVTISDVSIIDVDIDEVGITSDQEPGSPPQIVTYILYFADFRQRFASPRGGRLEVGLVNPDPAQAAGGLDLDTTDGGDDDGSGASSSGDGDPDGTQDPSRPNSDLIGLCLAAMGLGDTDVPASVDQVDPPHGLQWFGNHAPTELAKLLLHCGHVFVPNTDGTASICPMGQGSAPSLAANTQIIDTELPGIDRRGDTVVFTSYPNANIITQDTYGPVTSSGNTTPSGDGWELVAQDSDLTWKSIYGLTCCSNPVTFITQGAAAAGVAADDAPRLTNQLYFYMRYRSSISDPDASPVLHRVMEQDQTTPLVIQATVAVLNQQTMVWSNVDLDDIPVIDHAGQRRNRRQRRIQGAIRQLDHHPLHD
jgi:hypothetical protein